MGGGAADSRRLRIDNEVDMKKILILLTVMAFCAATAPELRAQDAGRIIEVSSSIQTLDCSFVQTKYLAALDGGTESSGRMVYDARSSSLRWEYLTPVRYAVVLTQGGVSMRTGDGKVSVLPSDNMFRRISELMAGMVSGKCFAPGGSFDYTVTEADGELVAEMIPRDRELRRVISGMTMYFDSGSCLLRRLEMKEKGGDVTVIVLSGVKVNVELAPDSFEL